MSSMSTPITKKSAKSTDNPETTRPIINTKSSHIHLKKTKSTTNNVMTTIDPTFVGTTATRHPDDLHDLKYTHLGGETRADMKEWINGTTLTANMKSIRETITDRLVKI